MANNPTPLGKAIVEQMSKEETLHASYEVLEKISHQIDDLNSDVVRTSQSDARNKWSTGRQDRWAPNRGDGQSGRQSSYRSNDDETRSSQSNYRNSMRGGGNRARKMFDDLTDAMEDQLWEALGASDLKKSLGRGLKNLADSMGTNIDDLGKELGKSLGKSAIEKIRTKIPGVDKLFDNVKNATSVFSGDLENFLTELGNSYNKETGKFDTSEVFKGFKQGMKDLAGDVGGDKGLGSLKGMFSKLKGAFTGAGAAGEGVAGAAQGATTALSTVTAGAGEAAGVFTSTVGPAAAGLVGSFGGLIAALGPFALIIAAVTAGIALLEKILGPTIEAIKQADEDIKKYHESVRKAANKTNDMENKMRKNAVERMQKDMESLVTAAYDVMKDAANEMMKAWDESMQTINATQGYTKADLQDLLGAFAQRLRDEGLSSVVSVADITTNLENVLKSGLSGPVAEEFAYLATKLNAAIPTEDFFQYASTYASVAANAIAAGQSQQEAIAYANQQLEQFASNLLYSSRQLAGGFSTGLTNAASLMENAVKIANTARIGDASEISGVLTSVSAVVGAMAPDLASSLVDNVVQAALGGNSTELVALRSLAGTGASNTAFLQAMAANPQEVFSELFKNLGNMQNMSSSNYMEVAEALSSVFGVSMDALARVDFNQLATAIQNMDVNNQSLDENMKLLASGQTTATAEQLRIQKINEYMIDEGLAYVLDNEVARAIQEHMWDEQLANELMENEYAVDLVGSSGDMLHSILNVVEAIFTMLNPFSGFKKLANLADTLQDVQDATADIRELLEATAVGSNAEALYNLTTRGTDLNLTQSYIEMVTGKAGRKSINDTMVGNALSFLSGENISQGLMPLGYASKRIAMEFMENSKKQNVSSVGPASKYTWANVGKSAMTAFGGAGNSGDYYISTGLEDAKSPQSVINTKSQNRMVDFLNSMQGYVDEHKSYDEWLASSSEFGFTNVSDAFEEAGLNEIDVQGQYQQMEAQAVAMYNYNRHQVEDQFWADAIKWYEETWPLDEETLWNYQQTIIDLENELIDRAEKQIKQLELSNFKLQSFYDSWIDYYVNHTAYTQETLNAYQVAAIQNAERSESGDAVLALAKALTSNMVDLKDPTVQSNVLLSQILLVAEAIMQLMNNTTTVSLPTALSSLGLGVTSETGQNIKFT